MDVQIASKSVIDSDTCLEDGKYICNQFSTSVIVMGGDACVPRKPIMAVYGATLACEFAEMLVQLAVSRRHLDSVEDELIKLCDEMDEDVVMEWVKQVKELKGFVVHKVL